MNTPNHLTLEEINHMVDTGELPKRPRLKLKPRTTYRRNNGTIVHIAGLTLEVFEGQQLWWSIAGDHYTDDGRLMSGRMQGPPEAREYVRFALDHTYIVEELTDKQDVDWWNGVVTERKR